MKRKFGFDHIPWADIQLSHLEVQTIIKEIKKKRNCSLLVFGCGNDSVLWEKTNARGTTAFIEDNAHWANVARAQLQRSEVHVVNYESRQADWLHWLDQPDKLKMDLPDEVRSHRWDVILVDGPAGEHGERPGRMKSIYAASGLVAPVDACSSTIATAPPRTRSRHATSVPIGWRSRSAAERFCAAMRSDSGGSAFPCGP